ncbi:L-Aspartase-like protein [Nemania serpens]|nr:L-Aspartase-like protein [Nemania serpens]
MASPVHSFMDLVLSQWRDPSSSAQVTLAIDGRGLTIADVVAVSRDLAHVKLTSESINAIEVCSKIIPEKIAKGDVIYGVNTGFGGSADTRSDDVERVQQSLISHLTCGILSDGKQDPVPNSNGYSSQRSSEAHLSIKDSKGRQQRTPARASMLIRLNSLAGGASGIRVNIAESLISLLNGDIVPRIPIRGSISASGDLSALAWIGALMQDKPSATAFAGSRDVDGARREGLAIVNGTAVSAGVAALAAYESLNLAALSQILTAMSVEALRGSDESFEPFIARVRPHAGQVDSARNIKAFLAGSRLLNRHDSQNVSMLRQNRYSLRTASQWIGPVLEDFCLAHDQLTVELNSVTDNPLIDAATGRVYHGGNFQARAVTSAAEKLRQGLQTIGRMLFAQCTEMINPATSWGLPPNLCSDDPDDSFLFKGLDVVVAGLTSELGFLANPVGSHVQTAEMGNQSLNSLALVSARYTIEAVDVLSQIASAHLLAVCQALDLRAIEIEGRRDAPRDATPYIGQASRRMYRFIREDLGIPFLGEEHLASTEAVTLDGVTPSIGLYNTRVYESIRSGLFYDVVQESFKVVKEQEQQAAEISNGNSNSTQRFNE